MALRIFPSLKAVMAVACLGEVSTFGAEPLEGWRGSVSGHARTMLESYQGLDLGLGPVKDDAWVHQRAQVLLTADYEETFRLASEFTWGRMWGKDSPLAPPDQDEVDFLQLYAQYRLPLGEEDFLTFKAGRQTLYYGSGRLLAAREGANQRLAHDALLLSWKHGDGIQVDAFMASPVEIEDGAFDNASHPDRVRFWSVYGVFPSPLGEGHAVDLYYIGLHDEDSIFLEPNGKGGRELRHTVGTRWWNKTRPVIYNTELIFQFGRVGDRDIVAGAGSLGIGYEFQRTPWQPTLMLRADLISGGGPDGDLHTFHPLFQANNYFNEGGFLSPSNLYNLNPVLSLKPHPKLEAALGVNFLWRFSAEDDVYAPPLQRLAGPAPDGERYLGTAFNAALTWKLTEKTEVFLGYTHHEAGDSLTSVGAGNEDYFQASFRVEF